MRRSVASRRCSRTIEGDVIVVNRPCRKACRDLSGDADEHDRAGRQEDPQRRSGRLARWAAAADRAVRPPRPRGARRSDDRRLHQRQVPVRARPSAGLLLPARGRRSDAAGALGEDDALPAQGRRQLLVGPRRRPRRRGCGLGLRDADRGGGRARRPRRVLLEAVRSLVRGGRGGVRPRAGPVQARRHAPELSPRPDRARRRAAGREPAAGAAVRDRDRDPLLPPARAI